MTVWMQGAALTRQLLENLQSLQKVAEESEGLARAHVLQSSLALSEQLVEHYKRHIDRSVSIRTTHDD